MIDYALKYIAAGFPVIPLCWPISGQCACGRGHVERAIGKVPLTEHGLKDATLTQQGVKEYWGRWPKANIGVVIPPGYFVLDLDVEHNGFESIGRLQQTENFELTPTLMITTGSGGQHYWYKTSQTIRNTARLVGYGGLDIRGQGGYVVAPPSIHRNGLSYQIPPVWDGPITEAPAKLVELCLRPAAIPASISQQGNILYLEGQRNDRLSRDAGAMRRRGLSEEAIYAALQVVNQEQCQPPLAESEVRNISKSISRYAPQPQQEGRPRFRGAI
mgnify:FL=1